MPQEALENCTGRGQKSSLSRVAKIAISKWTFKGHHSTSALATKLTEMQHPTSKSTVHQYLKTSLKLKSLKLRMQRWFTVNQKRRRLDFVKAHKTGPFRTRGVSLSVARCPLSFSKSSTEGTARSGPTAAQRCPLSGR